MVQPVEPQPEPSLVWTNLGTTLLREPAYLAKNAEESRLNRQQEEPAVVHLTQEGQKQL